jgi:hypothetical protein
MFSLFLTDFIGSTGNELLDWAIEFILFALIVFGAVRLAARLLRKRAPKQATLVEWESPPIAGDVTLDSRRYDGGRRHEYRIVDAGFAQPSR